MVKIELIFWFYFCTNFSGSVTSASSVFQFLFLFCFVFVLNSAYQVSWVARDYGWVFLAVACRHCRHHRLVVTGTTLFGRLPD